MNLKRFALASFAVSIIGTSACSTPTTISAVWRDPNYAGAPIRKLFVYVSSTNETNRRTAEDGFVATLRNRGIEVNQSYLSFPDPKPERQAVVQYLKNGGYDAALVVRYKGTQTRTTIEPYADFGAYYGWGTDYYATTDQYVKVESSLWDARTEKLIWSATSQTENPSSSSDAIGSVVTRISSALTEARLVPPPPNVSYAPGRELHM